MRIVPFAAIRAYVSGYADADVALHDWYKKTEKQYKTACVGIEELLRMVGNDTPTDDKNFIDLHLISDLVADYEEEHFPIEAPSLTNVIKLRMYEMGINQTKLSGLPGVGPSRISDYLTRRCKLTLKVTREMSRKLNIDASIVPGV